MLPERAKMEDVAGGQAGEDGGRLVKVVFGPDEMLFPSKVTAQQVIQFIRGTKCSNRGSLVLEALVNGCVVSLPDSFCLEDHVGWQYRARAEAFVTRRFGAGHAIEDAKQCYYIEPRNKDMEKILGGLRKGKYCVICDRRQSGKSTMAFAISRRLRQEGIFPVYIAGIGGARSSWDSSTMWRSLCTKMHLACPALFPAPGKEEVCNEDTFSLYLHKMQLREEVLLILDEADSLLNLSVECLDELFHAIRNVKSNVSLYRLKAFLLLGVETVRDLLEGHYDRRVRMVAERGETYHGGSTPSRLSPFPHDHTVPASRFEIQDVIDLMEQANKEHMGRISDVEAIATSIWQWTMGHKGLVGSCLSFMMQEEAFTHKAWLDLADSYKLGRYIFGQATYHRMMKYFKVQSQTQYDLLASFLAVEEVACTSVAHLRDLLAEGVLTSREEGDGFVVALSSPLLRTAILRRCSIVDQQVDNPPDPCVVDRSWVIQEAIRTLDADCMCRPEVRLASGDPSEYAHQFMFMCRIKAVLQAAYPFVGAVVLPEVKEVAQPWVKRSRLRLDPLVRDHQHFPRFGFEYLVDGTLEEVERHEKKAVTYAEQHSAQIYLMHFAMDKEPLEIQPSHDSVYFWSVRFNSDSRTAVVCTLDCTGARQNFALEMKNWNGKFNFKDIV